MACRRQSAAQDRHPYRSSHTNRRRLRGTACAHCGPHLLCGSWWSNPPLERRGTSGRGIGSSQCQLSQPRRPPAPGPAGTAASVPAGGARPSGKLPSTSDHKKGHSSLLTNQRSELAVQTTWLEHGLVHDRGRAVPGGSGVAGSTPGSGERRASLPTCLISGDFPLVLEARVPSYDEQLREAGELSDNVFGDAVAEIPLVRVAAHVQKRQDRNGRLVGQRMCQFREEQTTLHANAIDAKGLNNVVQLLLAEVLARDVNFPSDFLPDFCRRCRCRQALRLPLAGQRHSHHPRSQPSKPVSSSASRL